MEKLFVVRMTEEQRRGLENINFSFLPEATFSPDRCRELYLPALCEVIATAEDEAQARRDNAANPALSTFDRVEYKASFLRLQRAIDEIKDATE